MIILLIWPGAIVEVSFLLSFFAISGIFIILYVFPGKKTPGFKKRIYDYFKVASGAWLFVAPLIWFYWSRVSIYSLITNIFLLPVFSILLACAFSSVLASFISLSVGQFFADVSHPFLFILFRSSSFVSKLPFCYLKLPGISHLTLSIFYIILTGIIFLIRVIIKRKPLLKDR